MKAMYLPNVINLGDRSFLKMRLAAISIMLFSGGCTKSPNSYLPQLDPDAAAKAAIEQYDADYDSRIAGAELDRVGSLKSNLAKLDTNSDKAVTADEIAERIRYWQTAGMRGTRWPVRCMVFHNKQILAGAEVKLVPEKFLGGHMKTASGKTAFNGVAVIKTENPEPGDLPGLGPGFYRVEITKPGEEIPAKYNTETILGIDTTMDNPALYAGVRFALEYEEPKKKK
jgi:hypothetical protein